VNNALVPGAVVRERYEIQALIGQGGMGAVYRVADLRLPGRLCALKAMRIPVAAASSQDDLPPDPELAAAREQFLAEASTLGRLDHPNLPKVSDYFALDAYDCLVMDYVPGQDLQQCVQDARRQGNFLPEDELLDWTFQLCDVLLYLHNQRPPIIHGDVKPANIKLTADGRIKLVDFGLARPGDPDDPRTLTGSGLRGVGSLPYAALEQYAATARSDPRSDLYSLGATLYHLATNEAPASAHERFLDPAALRAPRQINPALSPALERAVLAALQIHPNDRPPSVAAWRQALPGRPAAQASEAPAEPADWRAILAANRWYAVTAALLALAAVVLTFVR
jgi:serine/threonine-protein kinase